MQNTGIVWAIDLLLDIYSELIVLFTKCLGQRLITAMALRYAVKTATIAVLSISISTVFHYGENQAPQRYNCWETVKMGQKR